MYVQEKNIFSGGLDAQQISSERYALNKKSTNLLKRIGAMGVNKILRCYLDAIDPLAVILADASEGVNVTFVKLTVTLESATDTVAVPAVAV